MFLSKRSNGIYYIFYENENGKRTCISTKAKYKNDAMKFFSNLEKELSRRKKEKVNSIKTSEFFKNFLIYSEAIHTPKTTKVYKTAFKYFFDFVGDKCLSEISTSLLNEYFLFRIQNTSVYAARKDYICLKATFNKAMKEKYLLQNPCREIKSFKIPEKQPLFLNEVEYQLLLRTIDVKYFRDLVIFAVNTGLRQGELIQLEWNQINFKDRLLILDNRNFQTKSKKVRTIPLNITALQILTDREKVKANEFVFTKDGEKLEPVSISQTFKKYVVKAKINRQLKFHSLRHTFASWLVQKGVSIYYISKLLGHSDIKTTEIYSHLRNEDLRQTIELLSN